MNVKQGVSQEARVPMEEYAGSLVNRAPHVRHPRGVLREVATEYVVRSDALEGLSDAALLARLLRGKVAAAEDLLRTVGRVPGLVRLTATELMEHYGLTGPQAEKLRLALELGRRVPFPSVPPVEIGRPADVADLLLFSGPWEQEHLWVVLLNMRHVVLAVELLYRGTLDRIVVRPAEVFRGAIRHNAAAAVLAHAQPSGAPDPSPEDLRLTCELIALGRRLDVPVLDHLILGSGRWVSLREQQPGLWDGNTS